jgi:hypothetical protein
MINSCNTRCWSRDPRKRVWFSVASSFLLFAPAKRVVNPVALQVVVPPIKGIPLFDFLDERIFGLSLRIVQATNRAQVVALSIRDGMCIPWMQELRFALLKRPDHSYSMRFLAWIHSVFCSPAFRLTGRRCPLFTALVCVQFVWTTGIEDENYWWSIWV